MYWKERNTFGLDVVQCNCEGSQLTQKLNDPVISKIAGFSMHSYLFLRWRSFV
jgi:hypothetical protein